MSGSPPPPAFTCTTCGATVNGPIAQHGWQAHGFDIYSCKACIAVYEERRKIRQLYEAPAAA